MGGIAEMWNWDNGPLRIPPAGPEKAGSKAVRAVVLLCAAGMAALVVLQSVWYQWTARADGFLQAVSVLMWTALLAAGVWVFCRLPWRDGALLAVTLGVCAALRLAYVLAVNTPIESDFFLLYDAASRFLEGDMSWADFEYYQWWGYQLPFIGYEALVLRLFPTPLALKLMNVVFMVGTDWLVYRIGRLFLSSRAAVAAAALYAVYPGAIYTASVLTNQQSAAFFLLLGIWLLLSGDRWQRQLAGGAALGVGNLLRPEGLLFVATILFCALYLLLRRPAWQTAAGAAARVALVLAVYWAVQAAAGGLLGAVGLAPNGIGNARPEWKFIVGLDAENRYGIYSGTHIDILYLDDPEERRAMTEQVIAESFRNCEDIPGFFLSKTEAMWAWDEPINWSVSHLDRAASVFPGLTVGGAIDAFLTVERAFYLLVWLALPAAAWAAWRETGGAKAAGAGFFCIVFLCAFFCVYLLIEVQPRYRYLAMPVLFALAGYLAEWAARSRRRAQPGGADAAPR